MVAPDACGDPMSPLRWTCKSLSQLASALVAMGHKIGRSAVGDLLHQQKFSLQANRKTREGDSHPDRDAQFTHLNASVGAALADGEPVISVDTKKKKLVADFKNAGREWRPRGEPEEVRVHDFLIEELGRAAPYGVYDLAANAGWVGVGMNNDTAAFAVQTIRRWWQGIGRSRYPFATLVDHHRRWWRQQWLAPAAVEDRAATPRQRARHRYRSASFAAWNQQVEQDRTPSVLIHHHELEGQAAGQLPRYRRPDRGNDNQDRPDRTMRIG